MKAFAYASPSNTQQAVQLLSSHSGQAALLAGGTDLLSLMKDLVVSPDLLVSLGKVQGLDRITRQGDALRIGAMVTLEQLLADPEAQRYPGLIQAAQGVTSPQIRSQGTVGGDLCQRPRCWYYRKGHGLLAQHNGSSMVRQGDNRYHAILGNSGDALFVNASSLAPVLIALQARVRIAGPEGERDLPLSDFYRTPQSPDEKEYALEKAEVLMEVEIPAGETSNATYEVRQREVLDWPLAAASVALGMQGSQVSGARVVLGHVAPVPWVSREAAQVLEGRELTDQLARQAGEAAVQAAKPLSRNAYKVRLARVAVERALLRAAGREI